MLIDGLTMAEPVGLLFPLTMMLLLTVWIGASPAFKEVRSASTISSPGQFGDLLRQPSC
jgi:hypothetical protein